MPDAADAPSKRGYKQGARARSAEQTAERILDSFAHRIRDDWFDQVTLDQIARDAGVTVPTVVRRFGSKEGLLDAVQKRLATEITERRRIAPGDIAHALAILMEDYEATGDLVMRVLAQEERHAPFKSMADIGRVFHRNWLSSVFAPWLEGLPDAARQARLDALVVASDIYVWKLARRDMGRSRAETLTLFHTLVEAIIGTAAEASIARPQEPRNV